MCYALIQVTYRGEKLNWPPIVVDAAEQLDQAKKGIQDKSEAIAYDVFLHAPHMSYRKVEEWKSKAVLKEEAAKIAPTESEASRIP